jgi:ribosome-associated protein
MGRVADNQKQSRLMESDRAAMIAARAASEKKGSDIVLLDLRQLVSFTDYFVICTGVSNRQVQAISDAVEEQLRKEGKRPLHIEGYSNAEWILLDYGDLIVHVFSNTARHFYDLERLWRDAGRVKLPDDMKS